MEPIKILILITMIFCHIVDDYYLQGVLASMKQKKWWEENAPDKLYKYDYIVALIMHGFSWTFMIMIVPILINLKQLSSSFFILFVWNILTHACIDNMKANMKCINLIEDQFAHLCQIGITWTMLIV